MAQTQDIFQWKRFAQSSVPAWTFNLPWTKWGHSYFLMHPKAAEIFEEWLQVLCDAQ